MKLYWLVIVNLGWAMACLAVPENVALNKPYTLSPTPNYTGTMDPGDMTQLTDGVYAPLTVGIPLQGTLWMQMETVGWRTSPPVVQCVIDLGQVEPICGASWNTAAGVAGVNWPENIMILVSDDQASWTYLGDLCDLGTIEETPPNNQYATFRYATDRMRGRGRYVCVIAAVRPYCFVDEIEVWRGPDAWLSGELPGKRTEDPMGFYENDRERTDVSVRIRLRDDLKHIFTQAEAQGFGAAFIDAKNTMDAIEEQIPAAAASMSDELQTILPYGELHTRILALNAPILRAAGVTLPFVWQSNRWDPITLSAIPSQDSAIDSVALDLMRGEVRGESFNITNPNDEALDLTLSINGMPEGLHLELREVLVTDTLSREPISAALQPLIADAQGASSLRVPAGCTRQIWLACKRPDVIAQTYVGAIVVASTNATFSKALTLRVRIRDLNFPKQPSLHVGGWDDVQGQADAYGAPGNLIENLALMREMYVDSAWATQAVFPKGASFDADGQLLNAEALDFSVWDAWVDRWQGARNYCVFFSVRSSFDGEPMGTPRFDAKVGSWLTAWVRHIEQQGLKPEQMMIQLVDEPLAQGQDDVLLAWTKAVRAANLGVVLFVNPAYTDPLEGDPEMYEAHDVLCPQTRMLLAGGDSFLTFYQSQREAGKTLWLYSCSGPAKELDPVIYHRAQAWLAFQIGAKGSMYWAFGCGGGIGNSWQAYKQTSPEYSPYFVGPTSVMEGKHSEALREGVQDYEYLWMLRKKANKVRAFGSDTEWLGRADALLDQGVVEALAAVVSSNVSWHVGKDRSAMDDVRVRILDALEDAPGTFDFVVETTTANETFAFIVDGAVGFAIDWDDGVTQTENSGGLKSHEFAAAGSHTIQVSGTATRIAFGGPGTTPLLLRDIVSRLSDGVTGITSAEEMFAGATNITQFTQADWFDVACSNVTSMKSMFNQATGFNQDIGGWDVGKVTSMYCMLRGMPTFNQDIGNWAVSNVTDMGYMFLDDSAFNQDISRWNVSKVTSMLYMLSGTTAFNQDIGIWNVGKVTNMGHLFRNASTFNQDIGGWSVSNVINMENTFYGTTAFNQDIRDWDVSHVTSMSGMFWGATIFKQDIGGWDVSSVTTMQNMFYLASAFNQYVGDWDVSNVITMENMFGGNYIYDQDLSRWNVSKVTSFVYFLSKWKGLSPDHYNQLLIRWSRLPLKSGVTFDGGGSKCDDGLPAECRQYIVDTFGWTFIDKGSTGKPYQTPVTVFGVR